MSEEFDVCGYIEENKDLLTNVSERIWEFRELAFNEFKSSELLMRTLNTEGFDVSEGIADIKTAFVGTYGSGYPIIAVLGEYDALPELMQKKNSYIKDAESGGNGHGCGHNLLGAGALGAALAVKKYLEENKISGTIKYFGCPAEENGAGKTLMAKAGCFDDVDIALCWHPGDMNGVWTSRTLSVLSAHFKFKGKTAHAAASPHLGRSALDAVELMNVGSNYLREHIIPEARVHYAITNPGGSAPNVVQGEAEVYYYIRAPKTYQSKEIYERIIKIAEGASLMTETKLEVKFSMGMSDYIPNDVVGKLMQKNFEDIGAPSFDEYDYQLAKKFRETFYESTIESFYNQFKPLGEDVVSMLRTKTLADFVNPYIKVNKVLPGSTDVGDVSYLVPTGQISTATNALATPAHTWQFTAQSASTIGYKGMLTAAKVMAKTAIDLINNHTIIEEAKEELNKVTNGKYTCPIPDEYYSNE